MSSLLRPTRLFLLCVAGVIALCAGFAVMSLQQTSLFPVPTRETIVGVWKHEGAGAETSALQFFSNGTFRGTNVPLEIFALYGMPHFSSAINWNETTDISGTWKPHGGDSGNGPDVELQIASPLSRAAGAMLFYQGTTSGVELGTVVGDSSVDTIVVFSKSSGRY
jgi:hypothetical protein